MSSPFIHTLPNGIRIVVEPMQGAQSAVAAFRFAFGAKDDPIDRLGMARLAEDVLFKGTPHLDARGVFDAFDTLGVRRSGSTSVESTQFQAQFLPRHLSGVVSLFRDVFLEASFPDREVEISKQVTLEELKRLEDSPIQQVMYYTYLAGLGDPMGRIPLGEPDTLSVITPHGVRAFWSENCCPEDLIIAVAGGVEGDTVIQSFEEVFGSWESGRQPDRPEHGIFVADRSVHHPKESEQEHIAMLFPSVARDHELYYTAQVAIAILSGSGSSRLFTEVREKRGLVYNVSAFYRARRGAGLMALYAGTTSDRADETLQVCTREIERLAEDVTRDELERAKTVLKGGLFTTGDLPEGRAGSLAEDVFLQGTPRSIEEIASGVDAVALERITEYVTAYPPSPCTLVTLGPRALGDVKE